MSERITLKDYQEFVETTWQPAETPQIDELRITYGISGEYGELCEVQKKALRDGIEDFDVYRDKVEKEFGDWLYYIAKYANFLDIELTDVLEKNVLKLESRKERGVINGSGDDR